jgi:lycopene cyclase domain-containing protein
MTFAYLTALVVSLVGLGLIDRRHRLALFAGEVKRTLVTVAIGVAFFLYWDVVGIAQGVFFRGAGPYQTGVLIGEELPLEEVFFLALLCYVLLLSYLGSVRWWDSRQKANTP